MCISYTIIANNWNLKKKIGVILISRHQDLMGILVFEDVGRMNLDDDILKYNYMITNTVFIITPNNPIPSKSWLWFRAVEFTRPVGNIGFHLIQVFHPIFKHDLFPEVPPVEVNVQDGLIQFLKQAEGEFLG